MHNKSEFSHFSETKRWPSATKITPQNFNKNVACYETCNFQKSFRKYTAKFFSAILKSCRAYLLHLCALLFEKLLNILYVLSQHPYVHCGASKFFCLKLLAPSALVLVHRQVTQKPTHLANNNKKSELMLMRRARAYSSSCSQVILVYLHPFCRNIHSFAAKNRQKIAKNQYF